MLPTNARAPIEVTFAGMIMLVKLGLKNAKSPIDVTLFGMDIPVRLEQLMNA
jgi:hypothetical protein